MIRLRILLLPILLLGIAGCGKSGFKSQLVTGLKDPQPTFHTDLPEELSLAYHNIAHDETGWALRQIDHWIKTTRQTKDKNEIAKEQFQRFLDHALYFKGMAFFERKQYYKSWETYEELVKKHSASPLFAYALYQQVKIARQFLEGTKRIVWGFLPIPAYTDGQEILEKVAERWPGSDLAGNALMILGDYHAFREKYLEAQLDYQLLVDNYKNTPFYEPALRKSALTTHAQYQEPYYDTNCLSEALLRFQQYQLSFPDKANELDISRRITLIRNQMALKEFEIADFYYRTHKISAARYYWTRIMKENQGTGWADQAAAMLRQSHTN